jgi:hypothetical protein
MGAAAAPRESPLSARILLRAIQEMNESLHEAHAAAFSSSAISIINAFRLWSSLFARLPSCPELMNRAQENAR